MSNMSTTWSPTRLDEALRLLADPDLQATPVAGCTDLLAAAHNSSRRFGAVVDLTRLPDLKDIRDDSGMLDIGAAVTFSQLCDNELIRQHAPALALAASQVGAWQIRNRATIGGNIANASPAGDALPVLLASTAELVLASIKGERRIPYAEMHIGYRRTTLAPDELITRIRLPKLPAHTVSIFRKVGTRSAQAISKVSVAFVACTAGGKLSTVRIAAGSVAAVPVRLRQAEQACEGHPLGPDAAERAAAAAAAEVAPIDDVRSTADYRRFVLGQVVRRILNDMSATAALPSE